MTPRPDGCPVVHFDHNSDEHSADPVASYRALREKAPVAWSEAHGGYWILSGYKPLFEAARDDDTFSSERNSYGGEGLSVVIPKTADAVPHPDRDRPARVPQVAQAHQPDHRAGRDRPDGADRQALRHLVHRPDHRGRRGRHDLGDRRPGHRHRRLAGPRRRATGSRYASAFHAAARRRCRGTEEYRPGRRGRLPLPRGGHPRGHRRARREHPTDDIISYLVQSEVDDRPVTDDEVFAMVDLLLSGGVGTTASLVSNTVVWLYQHPDVRQRADRRPVDDGQGDRGVPAVLLPHAGAWPGR